MIDVASEFDGQNSDCLVDVGKEIFDFSFIYLVIPIRKVGKNLSVVVKVQILVIVVILHFLHANHRGDQQQFEFQSFDVNFTEFPRLECHVTYNRSSLDVVEHVFIIGEFVSIHNKVDGHAKHAEGKNNHFGAHHLYLY